MADVSSFPALLPMPSGQSLNLPVPSRSLSLQPPLAHATLHSLGQPSPAEAQARPPGRTSLARLSPPPGLCACWARPPQRLLAQIAPPWRPGNPGAGGLGGRRDAGRRAGHRLRRRRQRRPGRGGGEGERGAAPAGCSPGCAGAAGRRRARARREAREERGARTRAAGRARTIPRSGDARAGAAPAPRSPRQALATGAATTDRDMEEAAPARGPSPARAPRRPTPRCRVGRDPASPAPLSPLSVPRRRRPGGSGSHAATRCGTGGMAPAGRCGPARPGVPEAERGGAAGGRAGGVGSPGRSSGPAEVGLYGAAEIRVHSRSLMPVHGHPGHRPAPACEEGAKQRCTCGGGRGPGTREAVALGGGDSAGRQGTGLGGASLTLSAVPRVLAADTASQQERLQAIAERRKRQAEVETKRRHLEDDRRQLQHLKSKALRERWLLEGAPGSASDGDQDMRRQMQEDEQRARLLEESVSRLEKEIAALENGEPIPITVRENAPAPSPARAPVPSPVREEPTAEVVLNSQQTAAGTPREKRVSNTPVRTADGSPMMKAAMYSVEITVERNKVTGETTVLSSTTLLPREPLPQGIKVYEDETKVVHAVDGALENGIQPLSSSEVDELIHKADEVTLGEASSAAAAAPETRRPAEETGVRTTPSRREITGVQAQPGEATSGPPGVQPGQEPPVTMIFMGYQNVEDEAETEKVLGLQDTITAELVVIEDATEPKEAPPPNGSATEPPAAPGSQEEDPAGPEAAPHDPQDLDLKKQRCKCCLIM
ncbi:paralemmin-1 [Ctenodactylus gundi]